MNWYHVSKTDGSLFTEVAPVRGGCLVRTYGWDSNRDTAVSMAIVFVPGVSLEDFGVEGHA